MNKFSPVTWWLAFRTLSSSEKESSFGWVTIISIFGLSVGVAALTITLGILAGFDREYKKIILGLGAHAVVLGDETLEQGMATREKLLKANGIKGVHPFIHMEAMIGFRGKVKGGILKGMDPRFSSQVSSLDEYILSKKSFKELFKDKTERELVLGRTLAQDLGVKINDYIKIIITPPGVPPKIFSFQVKDLFYSGMHEYDSRFAYLHIDTVHQLLLNRKEISGLELSVNHPEDIDPLKFVLETLVPFPHQIITWKEMNANLFAALKLERVVFFLVILPIVFVGALTVISALTMFIQEKQKEIAILRALGFEKKVLILVVLMQGFFIALVGIFLGFSFGTFINFILAEYPLIHLAPQVYFIDHLPVSIRMKDYILIGITSLIICLLSTLIPALKAARFNPVEGIRGY